MAIEQTDGHNRRHNMATIKVLAYKHLYNAVAIVAIVAMENTLS